MPTRIHKYTHNHACAVYRTFSIHNHVDVGVDNVCPYAYIFADIIIFNDRDVHASTSCCYGNSVVSVVCCIRSLILSRRVKCS